MVVFFERNFKTSHCQLQAVPIHKNQAPALKETFQVSKDFQHCLGNIKVRNKL